MATSAAWVRSVTPSSGRMWLVALTEAQAALAAAVGIAAVAGHLARRHHRAGAPPRFLVRWGLLAASALIPLLLTTGNLTVFIVANQLRLLWILAVTVWLLLRKGSTGDAVG